MRLDYHVLDVFTDKRFGGNPLAVVLDADALDGERMQVIAREFNLSETVFVLTPQNKAHTARVRIFTPTAELPFAGHPTVGTAALLAQIKSSRAAWTRRCPGRAGGRHRHRQGRRALARRARRPSRSSMRPSCRRRAGRCRPPSTWRSCSSLIPGEIGFENHRPTRFAAGNSVAFVPVASLEAIAKARVASHHWDAVLKGKGLLGTFLYCRQTEHTTSSFHARFFGPDFGVPEDPATGSAAVGFAGVIHRFDGLPDGLHKRVVEQGFEMGRPSLISLSLEVERGKLAHGAHRRARGARGGRADRGVIWRVYAGCWHATDVRCNIENRRKMLHRLDPAECQEATRGSTTLQRGRQKPSRIELSQARDQPHCVRRDA